MLGNATEPLLTVHVDAEREFSGGEVQVFLLLEGLRARGERVLLVAPPDSGALREARSLGIECAAVAMRGEWDLLSAWRIAKLLKERRADLVHLHTGRANWLGGLAARLSGVPAITTRRMDREVKRNLRTRILYGSWVRRAVAISGPVADLLRAGGVPPGKIEVIRDSIDAATLKPARDRAGWRADLGVADADMVVLVLANLVRRKGVDVLLEAISRAQLARTRLWIAGDGEERTALEAQCAHLGLGSRVRFLGRQQDKAGLILACDVLCLPSRREGMGVAALEALALGRPVLASAVGGLCEAVEDERSGLLVPPEDPAALAAALKRLESDPALRARLGAGGEHSLARGYRAENMVEDYAQLYRSVLAECRP